MNILTDIEERAQQLQRVVVFPESSDPRVIRAAVHLSREQICKPILVGDPTVVDRIARKEHIPSDPSIEIISYRQSQLEEKLAAHLLERRKHRGITLKGAHELLRNNPLFFGASLVATGHADVTVAGSVGTTGDVIKAAIQCIGLEEGATIASSIFLMTMPDGRVFTYGDCGVVPYPNAIQLADIAIQSSLTHYRLTGEQPVTAMLSFSSKGSARHKRIELVKEALEIARGKASHLTIDGELQFDAALVQDVAKRKAPGSDVAGRANVFIFPNLDAGNIAYKITERLAGATATGPILQGLAKPMMDLSRGCSWQDIVNVACVGVLMGEKADWKAETSS